MTFTLTYPPSSVPLPTNATLTIQYGDGNQSVTIQLPSTSPYTVTYTYAAAGNYTASFIIANLASQQTFTTTVSEFSFLSKTF